MKNQTQGPGSSAAHGSAAKQLMALVDGRPCFLPGETQKEAEDFLKLTRWLCGEKSPKIEWSNMEICGRCYAEGPTHSSNCAEKSELLAGAPIGMYHCPDCGAMVTVGEPHPKVCYDCLWGTSEAFDGVSRLES